MTVWAHVSGGSVLEVTQIDPAGRFHSSWTWLACPANVLAGWTYDGTTFSPPATPLSAVPREVSIMQGQLALLAIASPTNAGKTLLDDVNAAVAASTDRRVSIAWDKAVTLERHGILITQIAPTIPGLNTDAALDAVFVAASQIVV